MDKQEEEKSNNRNGLILLLLLLLGSIGFNVYQYKNHTTTIINHGNEIDSLTNVRIEVERELVSTTMELDKYRGIAGNLDSLLTDANGKIYNQEQRIRNLLKNEKDKDGRTEYLIEAKRMGIPVKLPHINDSGLDFKIEGKGIRFGLTGIKFISNNIAQKYIDARPFNSYKQLEEFTFTKGNGVNSRALNALRVIGGATFSVNTAVSFEGMSLAAVVGVVLNIILPKSSISDVAE